MLLARRCSALCSMAQPLRRPNLIRCLATVQSATGRAAPIGGFPTSSAPSEFIITAENGFLPINDPIKKLPAEFEKLEDLLNRMPLTRTDTKQPGLLATGQLGAAVENELPLYDVSNIQDPRLLHALFRDYTFLASAYLLEPCDIFYRKKQDYGLGRSRLPKSIAVPMTQVAAKLHMKPFMEYATSYSLYNYKRVDPSKSLEYDNLALIRGFSGMPSEHGFILVHVAMVAHSGSQVRHTLGALNAIPSNDRTSFNEHLHKLNMTMSKINGEMETMWLRSSPADYTKFRTFIMGTKNQPMFPEGVVYEGVSETPTFYRGESGANDSIVPSLDNFLMVTENMPQNALTDILRDFRSYRPENHTMWLSWLESKAKEVNVKGYALEDANSAVLYLSLLDQLRDFRARHWNFTKTYILKNTKHPIATGGSPIVTWLPNQLGVVLRAMTEASSRVNMLKDQLTPRNRELADELADRAATQSRILAREVEELKTQYVAQDVAEMDWKKAQSSQQMSASA